MVGLDFLALDVETADSRFPESICQIGVAVVRQGRIVDVFSRSVRTEHSFGWWQKKNLKITERQVAEASDFRDVYGSISYLMAGYVFCHTSYDRFAVRRACEACGHSIHGVNWLDSAQVVRRAWPERYATTGYGLRNVAKDLGIEFQHHDASEDARVVAEIVIRASVECSLDVSGWTERLRKPLPGAPQRDLRRDGNRDGPLYGEVVVLTGGFDLSQSQQADLAGFAGCEVIERVTKETTLVVVGNDRFDRGERSAKWRRAEELIQQGYDIRVISERDFLDIISD